MRVTRISLIVGSLVGAVCIFAVAIYLRFTVGAASPRWALVAWAEATIIGTLVAAWCESRWRR